MIFWVHESTLFKNLLSRWIFTLASMSGIFDFFSVGGLCSDHNNDEATTPHASPGPNLRPLSSKYTWLNIVFEPYKSAQVQLFYNAKDSNFILLVYFLNYPYSWLSMHLLTLIFPLPPFSHLSNKFYLAHCFHLCKPSQIFSEIKWSSKGTYQSVFK